MSLLGHLKSVAETLTKKKSSEFSVPVAVQRDFLSAFPEPTDDLERSYNQYLCQMKLEGKGTAALYHLAGLVLLPVYQRRLLSAKAPDREPPCDAVFLYGGDADILPGSLQVEFPRLVHLQEFQSHFCLTAADKTILAELRKRYPMVFYFRLKCMLKLGMYRWFYETYHPRALIVSSEYSFTSSFLTAWCRQVGIEHINVMHGEKLFYIRDSFFRFDRCYIWSEFYRKLFSQLRAEPTQFHMEAPPCVQPWADRAVKKEVDYTYYLQVEDDATLRVIATQLSHLREKGCSVAVRPHPLYSDDAAVTRIFEGYLIEDPKTLPIRTSILRTQHVISKHSSVLLQAHTNGIPIVIDDVSMPKDFQRLRALQYQMLYEEHTLLSSHVSASAAGRQTKD